MEQMESPQRYMSERGLVEEDGKLNYTFELTGVPQDNAILEGSARVVGTYDEEWLTIKDESGAGDGGLVGQVVSVHLPGNVIDERGWIDMRWRFVAADRSKRPSEWIQRTEKRGGPDGVTQRRER